MRARAVLAAVLLSLGGCRLFRCEVMFGPVIGADVHASGLVHTGLLLGAGGGGGMVYGRKALFLVSVLTIPFFHEQCCSMFDLNHQSYYHSNLGLLPPLTAGVDGVEENWAHPWAFEVTVAIGFGLRLGFDPIGALIEELERPEPVGPPLQPEFHAEATPEFADAARAYLAEAVAEYAQETGAAFELERPGRKDRIREAVRVCKRADEPVSIQELATWARSRLDGDDADARAATIARELARHCGVALRTIRFEGQ